MHQILALLHDMPGQLAAWHQSLGPWSYVLLFAIIFAETGLIVVPFLPGDSLLFAVGALCNIAGGPSLGVSIVLLCFGAILGDAVNYSVGRALGMKLFKNPNSKILNPRHLERTQEFYDRHGGKTIILARFIPIIRTYAPFVAGLGRMKYTKFAIYNVLGGIAWIVMFLVAGFQFGNIPEVKTNFHYVVVAIIVISVLPAVFEYLRAQRTGSVVKTGEAQLEVRSK